MTDEEIISELFKTRVKNRIARVDVGIAIGSHETQIRRTEYGKVSPRLSKVCAIAEVLGLEVIVRPKE